MPAPSIVRLRMEDVTAAAAALAEAFQDDPLQSYVFPDPVERAARSPGHFTPLLHYGLRYGEVLTNAGSPAGAAVWLGPDAWEVTAERAAASGLDQMSEIIGAVPAERFLSAIQAVEPYHQRDIPHDHWYVMVIGLAPRAQGQGLGRALLQPIMDHAAAEGLPCYLETAQPKNVAFYEHLGFERVVETVEPTSGLRLWTFRKYPPR
jgi:ribosomal protein S18 acetylase RimI-like enzyme